jgi:hypothetical protein
MIGPALFAGLFSLEGLSRPGYDALTMFVSELSLGPRGWIQIGNFVVYGALLAGFARGMTRDLRERGGSRAGPMMLWGLSVALILSGVFVMDPLDTPLSQRTFHGTMHAIAGAYVFLGWPVCLFILARTFRKDPRFGPFASWTRLAAFGTTAVLVLMTVYMKVVPPSANPKAVWLGLMQRAHIGLWLCWQFEAARRLLTSGRRASLVRG